MTEQIQDHMSAFVDDELSAEECAFLVRRLEHDPAARGKLIRYTTIGCALRGELLQPDPGILRRRLQEALSGAAPPAQQRKTAAAQGWRERIAKPALGVGIAASVAVVGVLALRMSAFGPEADDVAAPAGAMQADAWVEPSYVVPRDTGDQRAVAAPIRLTNYLMHHGEYASRLSRTSVDSNVVGARELPEAFRTLSDEESEAALTAAPAE